MTDRFGFSVAICILNGGDGFQPFTQVDFEAPNRRLVFLHPELPHSKPILGYTELLVRLRPTDACIEGAVVLIKVLWRIQRQREDDLNPVDLLKVASQGAPQNFAVIADAR